jgi:hypothetical protein
VWDVAPGRVYTRAVTRQLPAIGLALLAVACGEQRARPSRAPRGVASPAAIKAQPAAVAAAPAPRPVAGTVACSLLTRADADGLLGTPVAVPTPERSHCRWPAADGSVGAVVLSLHSGSQFPTARKVAEQLGGQRGFEVLPTIGDDAFYGPFAGHQVVFKVGNRYAQLSVVGVADAGTKQRAVAAARVVATRMQGAAATAPPVRLRAPASDRGSTAARTAAPRRGS